MKQMAIKKNKNKKSLTVMDILKWLLIISASALLLTGIIGHVTHYIKHHLN